MEKNVKISFESEIKADGNSAKIALSLKSLGKHGMKIGDTVRVIISGEVDSLSQCIEYGEMFYAVDKGGHHPIFFKKDGKVWRRYDFPVGTIGMVRGGNPFDIPDFPEPAEVDIVRTVMKLAIRGWSFNNLRRDLVYDLAKYSLRDCIDERKSIDLVATDCHIFYGLDGWCKMSNCALGDYNGGYPKELGRVSFNCDVEMELKRFHKEGFSFQTTDENEDPINLEYDL